MPIPFDPSDLADIPEIAEGIRGLVTAIKDGRAKTSPSGRRLTKAERRTIRRAVWELAVATEELFD
jgi:hypothetical protein